MKEIGKTNFGRWTLIIAVLKYLNELVKNYLQEKY